MLLLVDAGPPTRSSGPVTVTELRAQLKRLARSGESTAEETYAVEQLIETLESGFEDREVVEWFRNDERFSNVVLKTIVANIVAVQPTKNANAAHVSQMKISSEPPLRIPKTGLGLGVHIPAEYLELAPTAAGSTEASLFHEVATRFLAFGIRVHAHPTAGTATVFLLCSELYERPDLMHALAQMLPPKDDEEEKPTLPSRLSVSGSVQMLKTQSTSSSTRSVLLKHTDTPGAPLQITATAAWLPLFSTSTTLSWYSSQCPSSLGSTGAGDTFEFDKWPTSQPLQEAAVLSIAKDMIARRDDLVLESTGSLSTAVDMAREALKHKDRDEKPVEAHQLPPPMMPTKDLARPNNVPALPMTEMSEEQKHPLGAPALPSDVATDVEAPSTTEVDPPPPPKAVEAPSTAEVDAPTKEDVPATKEVDAPPTQQVDVPPIRLTKISLAEAVEALPSPSFPSIGGIVFEEDELNERGSLILEEGAIFAQAVISSKPADRTMPSLGAVAVEADTEFNDRGSLVLDKEGDVFLAQAQAGPREQPQLVL